MSKGMAAMYFLSIACLACQARRTQPRPWRAFYVGERFVWHRNGTEMRRYSLNVHGFKARLNAILRALPNRACRSGRGGRRFKSCHSDQLSSQHNPSRGTIWGMKRVTILPNVVPCRIFTATRDGCGNQGDSRTSGCAVWLANRDRGAAGPRSALPQEQTSKLDPPAIPSA